MKLSAPFKWLTIATMTTGVVLIALAGFGMFIPALSARMFLLFLIVIGSSGVAWICAVTFEARVLRSVMLSGIMAAAGAAIGWLLVLGAGRAVRGLMAEATLMTLTTVTAWAVYAALIGIVASQPMPRAAARWFQRLTVAIITGVLLLTLVLVWFDRPLTGIYDEWLERGIMAGAIIGAAVAFVLLSSRMTVLDLSEDAQHKRRPVVVVCPRCEREHTLETGGDRCPSCGLDIKVIAVIAGSTKLRRLYQRLLVGLLVVSLIALCGTALVSGMYGVLSTKAQHTRVLSVLLLVFAALQLMAVLPERSGRVAPLRMITVPLGWVLLGASVWLMLTEPHAATVFVVAALAMTWFLLIVHARYTLLQTDLLALALAKHLLPRFAMLLVLLIVVLAGIEWAFGGRTTGRPAIPIAVGLAVGSTALLTGVAIAALPLLVRMTSQTGDAETLERRLEIVLECPRCATRQTLPAGAGKCRACRQVIVIEIEEPRCSCGYPTYRLGSENCPECGRPVETTPTVDATLPGDDQEGSETGERSSTA